MSYSVPQSVSTIRTQTPPPPRRDGVPAMAWVWRMVANILAFITGTMVIHGRDGWEWWVTWTILAFGLFTIRAGQRVFTKCETTGAGLRVGRGGDDHETTRS